MHWVSFSHRLGAVAPECQDCRVEATPTREGQSRLHLVLPAGMHDGVDPPRGCYLSPLRNHIPADYVAAGELVHPCRQLAQQPQTYYAAELAESGFAAAQGVYRRSREHRVGALVEGDAVRKC